MPDGQEWVPFKKKKTGSYQNDDLATASMYAIMYVTPPECVGLKLVKIKKRMAQADLLT